MSTPSRLGTPVSASTAPTHTLLPPPPPVVPTSWLAPHEQRYLIISLFGLVEVIKAWDIVAPHVIPNLEPTWSSGLRIQGLWSAVGWTLFELGVFAAIALLRIPLLSPSGHKFVQLSVLVTFWNLACWLVAEPGAFFHSINLIGPAALGGNWYWNWFYDLQKLHQPSHISGVHRIRLLPYSTATLNPLSLSYCIPPDAPQPLYIPIVFNNSVPNQVSYYIRSLETGEAQVKTVSGSSLKRSTGPRSNQHVIEDEDEEDDGPAVDPLSALVLKSDNLDVSKLPSVKPADSLSLIPPKLTSSQSVLFLTVDQPSVITLKSVVDRRGDRFRITPHKEAVVIECPTGGHFVNVDEDKGKSVKKPSKPRPAQLRCVGDEEVAEFEARGVGALTVAWKKKSKDSSLTGVIEGIEDKVDPATAVDHVALARRDRISKSHIVPLRLQHDRPGVHTVSLTSVSDSLHNTYTPSGHGSEKVYNVISRPSARFDCSGPKEILQEKTIALPVILDGLSNEAVELVYSFQPVDGDAQQKSVKVSRRSEALTVSQPGTYTLFEINGPCNGRIKEPSSCIVELVPPPSLEMEVKTLHECAMDVGATVNIDFNGVPPFVVEYTEQRDRTRPITRTARFNGHVGELVLTPDQEGQYTYTFTTLSDAKYSRVKLDGEPITQTVHPLASVELQGSRHHRLFACSGNNVQVDFETKGADPLTLAYIVSYNGRSSNATWRVPAGKQSLKVPVPAELSDVEGKSGKMAITLLSIEDGNGCVRKLPAPTIDVEVDRKKPTVRFAQSDKAVVTEGQNVKAALRLTGVAPWQVTYALDGKETKVVLRDPNNALTLDQKGVYKLISVRDAHCPGEVLADDSYEVDFKARPEVRLLGASDKVERGGVVRRTEFCAGEEDQVVLAFTGQAPYELVYRYTAHGKTSRHVLKSAQETGILHLATDAGSHRYDFIELKDANYAKNPASIAIEHQVHSRPGATFSKANSRPLCLDTRLSGDAKVKLSGKAPFTLGLLVRKPAGSEAKTFAIQVDKNEWTLELPYTVRDVGRYEVDIVSVKDASGCEWDAEDDHVLSTTVEVVESARIVPAGSETDLCVGDGLDFLLQGKSPWVVEYEWLGKQHKVTSSASRFSRYAEEPGTFWVKSIALKDNQCKRTVQGLGRRVHPLPSVKIEDGVQSLREGDGPAAFTVSFKGTPPFSFTYTRAELVGTKWQVVETQTVTDISDDVYTISSSEPGDYTVTSVSDKYCRYPPLSRNRESV